ncbi:MAG: helix-hairpin-helix domain-containing protein [Paludibacteraceae bacterium]|nr:helix-hairpin-helix domain-containing protein [Paludibacteraceae bacterium]
MKRKGHIYFLLTGEQWLGLAVLLVLVVGTLVAVKQLQSPDEKTEGWVNDSTKAQFVDYQEKQDSIRKAQWRKRSDTIVIRMQAFDPNVADSSTLVHLGFKPWQAKNMLKYRAAGGRYRKPEDLKRLYGMTDSMYLALAPYITIAQVENDSVLADTLGLDSLPVWTSEKKDTLINLRTADTTELKMIRGIGSYRARQIVGYRERLGGFVRVEQVKEILGMDSTEVDSILAHLWIDSVAVEQMNVNTIGVQRLSRHPYLRFEQAKAIYELRRREIRLDSIQQLQAIDCISGETLDKIAPYLNFDKK